MAREVLQFPISTVTQSVLAELHLGLDSYLLQAGIKLRQENSIPGSILSNEVKSVISTGMQLVGAQHIRNSESGEQAPFAITVEGSESFALVLAEGKSNGETKSALFIEDVDGLINNKLIFSSNQEIDEGIRFSTARKLEAWVNDYLKNFRRGKTEVSLQRLYVNAIVPTDGGGNDGERIKAA